MSEINRYGLISRSSTNRNVTDEDFPIVARETPPLPPGRPFADDLDACDRRFGATSTKAQEKTRLLALNLPKRRRGRPPAPPPDPALPVPPRAFVAWRAGYGGVLAPLTFTVRGGEYAARADVRRVSSLDAIFRAVSASFGVDRAGLVSPRRSREVTRARVAFCVLAVEFTDLSLPRIGRAVGGRDHSTILHAVRKARWLEANDAGYVETLGAARARLRNELPAKEDAP